MVNLSLNFLSLNLIFSVIIMPGPRFIHSILDIPVRRVKYFPFRLVGHRLEHLVREPEVKQVPGFWQCRELSLWLSRVVWALRVDRQPRKLLYRDNVVLWQAWILPDQRWFVRVVPDRLRRVRHLSIGDSCDGQRYVGELFSLHGMERQDESLMLDVCL